EVTENDILMGGSGNVLAQIGKLAHMALAAIFATELRPHGVAAVAITPGFLRSESMLDHFGVSEANWREGGKKDATSSNRSRRSSSGGRWRRWRATRT